MSDSSHYYPWSEEEEAAMLALPDSIKGRSDVPESELWPKIRVLLPASLKRLKEKYGADYIRKMGFNTERADREFGPGWLDE